MNFYKYLLFIATLTFATTNLTAQEQLNDCVGAITVCGNGNFETNVEGSGDVFEINNCGGFEHHSLWMKIEIVQDGELGFDLIPNDTDISVDYDFWVFGPDRPCDNLGTPIRCATTNPESAGLSNNHTGINGSTTLTQSGPGASGNGYVHWLQVKAGEHYYIAIDRPHGDGGFKIEWTGTATQGTGAFPPTPEANQIEDIKTCSSNNGIGLFDFNSIKTLITDDLTNNDVTFYPSLADAMDETNALPSFYANKTSPEKIYAKVTSKKTSCYDLTEFNLIVTDIPELFNFTVSNTNICTSESVTFTIEGTPNTTVLYDINNNGEPYETIDIDDTGKAELTLTPTEDLTIKLVEIAVMSNGEKACKTELAEEITVTVTPATTPTFDPVDAICVGESLAALPTTSNNGITGSWSPAIDNTQTTTYTFTPDAGQCAAPYTMTIEVKVGITPTFDAVNPICEGATLTALPTTSNNGVTGTWSPALDNTQTTTYTFTPDAGQCAATVTLNIQVTPNLNPVFDAIAPICAGDSLTDLPTTSNNGVTGTWSPALDNTQTTTYTFTPDAGQCATSFTLEIIVNPIVIPEFTPINSVCEGQTLTALPTTSNNGIIGTWSPALDNTQTTTYTFTPDEGQCADVVTLDIVIIPIASSELDFLKVCTDTNDGYYPFDLIAEIPNILGTSQPEADYNVTFYTDAAASQPITSNPYTNTTPYNQTIYVSISHKVSGCDAIFPIDLVVEDKPIANTPLPLEICDTDNTNDGFTTMDLTILDSEILNEQNSNSLNVTYYLSETDAENGTNAISNPSNFTNTTAFNQTLYIRVDNTNNTLDCYATTTAELVVYPILQPVISSADGINTLCVDFNTQEVKNEITLVSDLQDPNYIYTWYLNGNEIANENDGSLVINTDAPGDYTVAITERTPTNICNGGTSDAFTVLKSGQASLVSVSQPAMFSSHPTVKIVVEGYGDYWFQMDDGPIVDNGGVFTNVSGGVHTVYVYDRTSEFAPCEVLVIEDVRVVDFPKFFTPNNDGYNDTWNVSAIDNQTQANITIFDRYGKLLAYVKPSSVGWDGTFKGQNLPSDDYWFILNYEVDGVAKVLKSHFTLKR
ncbi:T9SS type B sorting domain-containing protein [Formosa sp. A9]|uniref:T9SS type B sorting domain-containing protein n=1 Tax=Formosa sp. A9 TaxID=3442641 RepID=UPI003EBBA522